MGKATQDLRNEHGSIVHVLQLLDRMLSTDSSTESKLKRYGEVVEFLKVFADKCHHGKEETFFFPALLAKGMVLEGDPIGSLLEEHRQGRQYIAAMGKAVETKSPQSFDTAARAYRDLMIGHIKDEADLFASADRLLTEDEQERLFEEFEKHEESVIGHGVHEQLHAMIERWATELGVR